MRLGIGQNENFVFFCLCAHLSLSLPNKVQETFDMTKLPYKVLFIDLDDTIWDFRANSMLALRQAYDELGLSSEIPDYDRFKTLYMTANKELWEAYHHSRVTKDFLIVERFARPFREVGSPVADDKAFIMRLNDRYLDILARQKKPAAGKAGWKRWYLSGMCPKGQHKTEGSALKAPLALDSVENHLNRKRRHPHNSFLSSKAAGIPAAWKPVCHYTAGKAKCQMKRE